MTRRETIAPGWQRRLGAAGLPALGPLLDHDPTELQLAGRWTPLTKPGLGGRQRWRWEFTDAEGRVHVVYVKRYAETGLKAQLDRIVRQHAGHTRAWWEFAQARRLAETHIPAPEAVGAAECLRGWWERRGVVLLAAAPGDAFDRVWPAAGRRGDALTRGLARHDIAVRLGRFVAAFHQTGYCHRDLYLCHVFLAYDADGEQPPRLTLIDLARTFRPRLRRMRWIIKDLAQLDASSQQIGATRADRLRFLCAYLGLQPGAPRVRWYARRVVRKSDWILRRIARQSATS